MTAPYRTSYQIMRTPLVPFPARFGLRVGITATLQEDVAEFLGEGSVPHVSR